MFNRGNTQKPPIIIGLVSALGPAAANADQRDLKALEEVTVTGSYLRTSQGDMPSPIEVLEREEFADQGISTPAEFISTLTINAGAENSADNFTGGGTFGTSNINLRGLGIGANLVLLNGRRQTQSAIANDDGETFVDIASLAPMIALERVEVLKDGASSLYGSDAISGVVNFVTRGGFEGFEIHASYQTVTEGSQSDAELGALWGAATDRSSIIVAGHYMDRSSLTSAERVLPGRRAGDPRGPAVSGLSSISAPPIYLTRAFPRPFPPWATILKSTMRAREPCTWGLKKRFNSKAGSAFLCGPPGADGLNPRAEGER